MIPLKWLLAAAILSVVMGKTSTVIVTTAICPGRLGRLQTDDGDRPSSLTRSTSAEVEPKLASITSKTTTTSASTTSTSSSLRSLSSKVDLMAPKSSNEAVPSLSKVNLVSTITMARTMTLERTVTASPSPSTVVGTNVTVNYTQAAPKPETVERTAVVTVNHTAEVQKTSMMMSTITVIPTPTSSELKEVIVTSRATRTECSPTPTPKTTGTQGKIPIAKSDVCDSSPDCRGGRVMRDKNGDIILAKRCCHQVK